ncbi:hypothetical protein [Solirubrobacter deserti]|uniref:Transcriptional regulator Rv0078-like C-terminal domain-containing protein n=1 Tax=Solirubrobacter deserti TaxID=2282478 RepID=A0ABT4RQ79_9ACTN|nr:hypothetical protein [Solirubrobacter deserti]MDA0140719.1 hypothetical protein [Solirubrobacter deserti]
MDRDEARVRERPRTGRRRAWAEDVERVAVGQHQGALNEAAIYVADAEDPARAREEVRAVLDHVLAGVRVDP